MAPESEISTNSCRRAGAGAGPGERAAAAAVFPAFTGIGGATRTRAVLVLTNLGIAGLAIGAGFDAPRGVMLAFLAVGITGVLLFISEMHQVVHTRARKELDLGLLYAACMGWISLMVGGTYVQDRALPGLDGPLHSQGRQGKGAGTPGDV